MNIGRGAGKPAVPTPVARFRNHSAIKKAWTSDQSQTRFFTNGDDYCDGVLWSDLFRLTFK